MFQKIKLSDTFETEADEEYGDTYKASVKMVLSQSEFMGDETILEEKSLDKTVVITYSNDGSIEAIGDQKADPQYIESGPDVGAETSVTPKTFQEDNSSSDMGAALTDTLDTIKEEMENSDYRMSTPEEVISNSLLDVTSELKLDVCNVEDSQSSKNNFETTCYEGKEEKSEKFEEERAMIQDPSPFDREDDCESCILLSKYNLNLNAFIISK